MNPPRLAPGTYAVDDAEHGRDRVAGMFVLSPGDLRGLRFVHERADIGCFSLSGWQPCLECENCGVLVASRLDDCLALQETRLYPDVVVCEPAGDDPPDPPEPFALGADWDRPDPVPTGPSWAPRPTHKRPELRATRWRIRGLKSEVYRDDPPS